MDIFNNAFDVNKITKGQLITIYFQTGTKRSGVVNAVSTDSISYTYFDETVGDVQSLPITIKQVQDGLVTFYTADHLARLDNAGKTQQAKPNLTKESTSATKEPTEEATGKSFFESLQALDSIETLLRVFKKENVQTLALIASYLSPNKRTEFLYRLPDNLFESVKQNLQGSTNIDKELLRIIEKQLQAKYDSYRNSKNTYTNEPKQEQTKQTGNPFDALGGLGSLLGGFNPEDLLKNFNPSDLKGMFGNQSSTDKESPAPNPEQIIEVMQSLAENMPKILNDLFGRPSDDEEDNNDDFRR